MKYTIHVHGDYAEAVTSGDVNLVDGKACIDEVFNICRQHELSNVLVNGLQLSEDVTVGTRFVVGEYLATHAPSRMRVAILVSTKLANESKALQNTANNRGAQVITTDSLPDAMAFLGMALPG